LQKFFKTIKKPKGTVAIVGEIKRKDPTDPEFAVNMPDAAECSKAFHDCKIAAVAVWVDEELYGCSMQDLKAIVTAQASFKGEFPGPCPVLACGLFVGQEHVVQVAEAGAAAVLLSAAVLDDELESMIECGKGAGVESVVLCSSEAEVDSAVAAGATIVALDGKLLGVNTTIEMIESMGTKDGVVVMSFGGVTDISDAWRLRDAGCNCALVGSELMYAAYGKEGEVRQGGGKDGTGASLVRGDVLQLNDVKAYARGLMAKASIKYASSSLNSFKEQGAGSIPTPDRPGHRCLVSGADVGFPASRLQTALHCRLTTLGVTVGWNPVCSSVRSCPATPIKAFVRRNVHVSD